MDKTLFNAQLYWNVFLSPQICWLRKIRSVEKFWLDCQWKEWLASFVAC